MSEQRPSKTCHDHAKRVLQDWIEDAEHAASLSHWPDLLAAYEWLRSVADGASVEPAVALQP